ncbi:unannotated protein [freshwater metagenome]|uniref:Unannotated protein n=1 Tax=freshwater metagenome TaxID=449393 RepID=A0A6J6BYR0_9ZZZZ
MRTVGAERKPAVATSVKKVIIAAIQAGWIKRVFASLLMIELWRLF